MTPARSSRSSAGPAARPALPTLSPGHGQRRGRSPFGPAAPSIAVAIVYTLVLLGWLAIGDVLPGGRWFAIHLFTLGVLTNVVLTFSEHFARTVTRTVGERSWWWPVVTNLGILAVLVGLPSGWRPLLVVGATVLTVVVMVASWRIRTMRRQAVGARFAWIARIYERAHGAFVHGAVLGALLGAGVATGGWYLGARTAHLHANVLGWGGLTLLATLVFFGPTMARTRIEDGADDRAARWLRHGATGLSVAVLALLLIGLDGGVALGARVVAAGGLAVYAVAATLVCLPVARAVWGAKPTAPRPLVAAVCGWFTLVVWADVAVVATGAWRWLDAVGVAALAGVLAQAVLATLVYLTPLLRGRTTGSRDALHRRLEVGARTRALAASVGVVACVGGATRLVGGLPLLAIGWALLAAVVASALLPALWPFRALDTDPAAG